MQSDVYNIRIAVDFDGTIVENEYPGIGKDKLFAFETLNEMQKRGFKLILWTVRTGEKLEEAVKYCREKGIEFYAVNKNYPEEEFDEKNGRKIQADVYIDDKNVGGFPGWSRVWQMLNPDEAAIIKQKKRKLNRRKNNFIIRLTELFTKRK